MPFRIGIDSGGTFTDLLAIDEHGTTRVIKVPSTPASPDLGVRDALAAFLTENGGEIEAVLHGTTVAVNAILQRKFRPMGILVTHGFSHIVEMARQTVPGERGSIYVWVKPPRIVPLANVREVPERMDARGGVITPFDEAACRAQARWFKERAIDTVAVCFINAYADGAHERRAREILLEEYPGCHVAISSETLPEYREYERAITTCMSALLMPLLGDYVRKIQGHMAALGITAPLYMMKSGGGASRADLAVEQPVHTALSGPAAAVVGSAWLGRNCGRSDIITFDMGGTSTDVALIENGRPAMVSEVEVDVYPIRTPAIDVVTVGAGGGSLAWLAPGDRLQVGPRSAGADPGPACYGRGGTAPTITDANVFLGRLGTQLAGGAVTLNADLAAAALTRFGAQLGLSALELARGIVEIGEMNMADAIRQASVQKGRDPRLFTLTAGGGAGPLHACGLAETLRIPEVLIPPSPGIGCSLGALVSDVREDVVMTDIQREEDADAARLHRNFGKLEDRATEALERQGFAAQDRVMIRAADLRYRGMRTELNVILPAGAIDADWVAGMFDAFHDVHQQSYGYAYRSKQKIEVVNLRVTGLGKLRALRPKAAQRTGAATPTAMREVYFAPEGFRPTPIYARATLTPGTAFAGPAIVEQYDTTTVIHPGQQARVDDQGNLIVATAAGAPAS